jgi:hypothetical protein
MPVLLKRLLVVAGIVVVHAITTQTIGFACFCMAMSQGENEHHWLVRIPLKLYFFLHLPYFLVEKFGWPIGPVDGGRAVAFSSVCWTLIICTVWYAHARTRKWLAS